jgi:two-component system phosphate regulon sensor histidine kinase PhoR
LRRRILVFTCLLAAVSIVLTAVLIHMAVYRGFAERVMLEMAAESDLIVSAVNLSGVAYLQSISESGSAPRVTLIDRDGRVIFDNGWDASIMENHMNRPEIKQAVEEGIGEDIRFSATISRQTFYRAARLPDGKVLRVAMTTDSVFAPLPRLTLITLAIVTAVFAAAAVIGTRVTRRIVAPINMLNLDRPEENAVYAELAPLLSRMKRQNDIIAEQMDEIRQRQIEFSTMTDNMREGMLLLDDEAHVLSCNRSALELLHANSASPVGKGALTLNRSEPFYLAVERALGGYPAEEMLAVSDKHLRVMANPVRNGDAVCGAVVLLVDVTEREDREKLRREFTANVSHELSTPLTAISGYAEIIANGVAKGEDIPRFAESIYDVTQRLIAIVGDVMALSRLDEGVGSLPQEPVDLDELVNLSIQRTRDIAERMRVSVHYEGGSSEVRGVRRILDEAVMNVIDNAIKYNVEGGSVRVTLERLERDAGEGVEVVFTVSDTGIGIPPDEQERIFERFYRVDRSRCDAVPGTGLGLSIVKHAVKLHNGRIEVKSDGRRGSSVTLRFPA